MICPKCGVEIQFDTVKFCPHCGSNLVDNTQFSIEKTRKSGIRGLVHSIFAEFTSSVPETLLFLLVMNVPILDIILFCKLGLSNNAPPRKKAFVIADFILVCITTAIEVALTFWQAVGGLPKWFSLFT